MFLQRLNRTAPVHWVIKQATENSVCHIFFQQNQWGERYIPEVNRDNFDAVASVDYYRTDLDVDLAATDTLHVIIGSDSGLLLNFLLKQSIGAGSRVVLIEPDDLFGAN